MKKAHVFLGIILLIITSCSSDDNNSSSTNNLPPSEVTLISPNNEAISVDKTVTFNYNVAEGDPDGDTIVYDIYLNNGINETKIAEDYNETSFTYENPLGLNRNYTWRVVAKDGQGGQTESETFSFITRKAIFNNYPSNFVRRYLHSAVFFNNEFVLIGGYNSDTEYIINVTASPDANSWSTARSLPIPLSSHSSIVFNDKLWVTGGSNNTEIRSNDIYNISNISFDMGESWELVNSNPAFSERAGHTLTLFNDKMYLIGGRINAPDLAGYSSEVWMSSDGINWEVVNINPAFHGRVGHTSVAFDNKIWVIGGTNSNEEFNDIWFSEDGVNWEQATSNAPFSARMFHSSAVYDNKIWVYGGTTLELDSVFNDLWYSEDGINWFEAGTNSTSTNTSLGVYFGKLIVKDGFLWSLGGINHFGELIDYVEKIN